MATATWSDANALGTRCWKKDAAVCISSNQTECFGNEERYHQHLPFKNLARRLNYEELEARVDGGFQIF